MLFSSMTFIYIYLPLMSVIYFVVRKELRNLVLLIGSIIFYGWGEPNYLVVMILTILVNYIGAVLLTRYRRYGRVIMLSTIMLDLIFIAYF